MKNPSWFLPLVLVALGVVVFGDQRRPPCDFPAIYNFGDSNSDTGGIYAAFLPPSLPYGETFFKRPAGRASDGRLIVDFIAEKLEMPYLSAYLDSIGSNFSHGANFATGSSTIRRQNGSFFESGYSPFSLDVQVWHHQQFKPRTMDLYNRDGAFRSVLPDPRSFEKALYMFDIGQNDLSAGFMKMSNEQLQAAIPDIIAEFSAAIKNLYGQGARLFWVHNTGPIGCLPVTLPYITDPKLLDRSGCYKVQNDMATAFNGQLKDAVDELRKQLQEAAITYVDMYAAKYGLISNAKAQGFEDPLKACCGYHERDGHVYCGQKGKINNGTEVFASSCDNPERHISWDGIHYTEAANHWIANLIVNGSFSDPPLPITQACYRS